MNSRITWVDSLRGFAMVLVILGHVFSGLGRADFSLRCFIYSFHMPLFFGIAGFVAEYSSSKREEVKTWRWGLKFIAHKFQVLVIPYLIWSVVAPVIYGRGTVDGLIDSAKSAIVYNTSFWFLPTLFFLSALFAITTIIIQKSSRVKMREFIFGVLLLQILTSVLFIITGNSFVQRTMNYVLPYYAGVFMAKYCLNYKSCFTKIRLITVGIVFVVASGIFVIASILYGDTSIQCRISRLIAGIMSIYLLFWLFSKVQGGWLYRILQVCGCNTLILYVLGSPLCGYRFITNTIGQWINVYTILPWSIFVSFIIIIPDLILAKILSLNKVTRKFLLGKR